MIIQRTTSYLLYMLQSDFCASYFILSAEVGRYTFFLQIRNHSFYFYFFLTWPSLCIRPPCCTAYFQLFITSVSLLSSLHSRLYNSTSITILSRLHFSASQLLSVFSLIPPRVVFISPHVEARAG